MVGTYDGIHVAFFVWALRAGARGRGLSSTCSWQGLGLWIAMACVMFVLAETLEGHMFR